MQVRKTIGALLAVGALFAAAMAPASAAPVLDKSDNVKHVEQFKYTGGTELARSGKYLYSGELNGTDNRGQDPEKGGLHIFDITTMKEVGFLHCPGTDNDVEVIKPGLVAMGFSNNTCAPSAGGGIMIVDVKDPKKPRIVSSLGTNGASHTFKPFPGKPLIYMAGGGLSGGNGAGPVIVDVSNPAKPKVVAEPKTITMDCHDISFSVTEEDRQLGFCAGAIGTGEVKIWDVSDPLAPVTIGEIVNPVIEYSHYATANYDGTLLAIDDEAFAVHDCNTGQSPTGRVWIYDITDPKLPIVQSSFAAQRGGNATYANIGTYAGWTTSWCLSHGLDWHPTTNNVAVTWFTGGVSVLDLNDPLQPKEVAWFQAEDSTTYSTLWHGGYLFTNDMYRGVDAFKISGLK